MNRVVLVVMLMLMPFVVEANKKQRAADLATTQWNYEIERATVAGTAVVGDGKSVSVKVWSFSKDPVVASSQSFKNAVHGVIFKGVPVSGRVPALKPMCDLSTEMLNAEFFNAFFATGGPYMRFVMGSSQGGNTSVLKLDKKSYKVGVNVVVNVSELRRELESAGIIKSLGGRF